MIAGEKSAVVLGAETLNALYQRLEKNLPVDNAEVDAAIRLASDDQSKDRMKLKYKDNLSIQTPKGIHTARSSGQLEYIRALSEDQMVFGIGPAGTGKRCR